MTLNEAKRVVRDSGLIVITDNAKKTEQGLTFSNSWETNELRTFVWVRKGGVFAGPFDCALWESPKCDRALDFPEFAELSRVVANS